MRVDWRRVAWRASFWWLCCVAAALACPAPRDDPARVLRGVMTAAGVVVTAAAVLVPLWPGELD